MKLIEQYSDLLDAERVSKRIRRAGVMTVVTSKRSHNLSRVRTGALKVGLWAVFDDQHLDAIQLLENRKHKPSRVISLEEMAKLENTAKEQFASTSKKILEKAAHLYLVALWWRFFYTLPGDS
ncbi:MAG: hypothetical protein GY792_33890 [Gammaproteobacteria bacterium]|nr:hypothetical protein [Gammaproteobacteria bacterium]